MKERIETYVIIVLTTIVIILSFFVVKYSGENNGLRKVDSKTITELRQTAKAAKALQIQNGKLQQVVGNTARRDSMANIILQEEINRVNGK